MKKIVCALAMAGLLTACGDAGDRTARADSASNVSSTTPPLSADSANPIGVMMSDTTISVYDSLKSGD